MDTNKERRDMTTDQVTTTALIKVNPSSDAVVIALSSEAMGLQKYAEERAIVTDEAVHCATEDLSLISKLKKAIEDKRKEYVSPIKLHLDTVNETFKTITEPLSKADGITRAKIMAYRQEQERKAREVDEINRLRMEAAQKEMALKGELTESVNLVEVLPPQPAHVRTGVGMMGTTKTWKFEVVDFAALPSEYKVADLVKIGKVVRAGVAVPGVKAWQEESIRITTSK
jgi:hypothetical protein